MIGDVFKSLRDGLSWGGNLYALPFYGESSMLMYRKDLFADKGLKMPAQPKNDEIAKFADALTDKSKGIFGITLCPNVSPAPQGTILSVVQGWWWDVQLQRRLTIYRRAS
jgi:sorbitol/mannitol transport system substrate-binding protein